MEPVRIAPLTTLIRSRLDRLGDPTFNIDASTAEDALGELLATVELMNHSFAAELPSDPSLPRGEADKEWGGFIEERRNLISKVEKILSRIAKALKAASYSISIAFPWGVTISISFNAPTGGA